MGMDESGESSGRVAGAVVRYFLRELEKRKVAERVLARAPPALAPYFAAQPGLMTWLPVERLIELFTATGEELGRDELRTIAHETTRAGPGQLVLPVIRTTIALSGGSPASVFSRLDVIVGVQVKNHRFTFTEESPRSGTLRMEFPYQPDDHSCAGWEGALLFTFDVCSTKGDIRTTRCEGTAAVMQAQW